VRDDEGVGHMMRRLGIAGFVVAMGALLTGCPVAPPGYQPPKLVSSQVSPAPAHPGDTVTFTLDVTDDGAVTAAVPRRLYTPSGSRLPSQYDCDSEMAPQGDFHHVVVTVTCPLPQGASNGTWQLEMFLNDSSYPTANYPGSTVRVPFEVTGGTEDRRPPRLVSYSIEPTVVDQETTFTVTARLSDEALPLSVGELGSQSFNFTKLFAQNSVFWCSNPTLTPVSATEVDVVANCTPSNYYQGGRSEPGLHLSYMKVRDDLGQEGNVEMYVDVVPGP
jgi:hypothetical protein